ncbi:MAG: hypothetical protein A2487_15300 [Candidatus Raymondbacteria bacterium RifOxyC12_full_50_8]|uniref:Uncharacterized protein n=1 Tax=Candidatus Raymondbacteria bacterium RIFOXYD12_FULL_49_13 TaxID=1817890 RepID=A0A1F7FGP1_UNCRA|nr:MAG: hypothetical protein A2248_05055 [Candidatus Raymondbacteria bacterium RIFOXYA2_FULL_49_16]OGJ94516.1 MAG: hypothetical protein A2487_15300 [Candidatus Raymondbacteria bacterium RifOxyC12_full_50_8]OGJ99272.1 MAG: hypothetical protein A2350_05355 [Candidatus Raymondbacteria bacterium RifOxyB12_full_50_8]OGK05864.1 MAG: hypothetical protein A2519_04230 [Candidatus Raymondbacteria bacterium RIFOXYD12_FULL_49_13]OGP43358.1 MAG: hypothetical protein A2324_02695 [Candidatus Raymondbacteria b
MEIAIFFTSPMPKLVLEKTNLIIVGAWNNAIIQPNWLSQYFPELIKEKEIPAEFVAGPTTFFRFIFNEFICEPRKGSLIFTPKKEGDAIFSFISQLALGIYDKLPHTPILAVGHNFVFHLEDKEHFALENELGGQKRNIYKGIVDQEVDFMQIKHTFSFPTNQLNLIYDLKASNKSLAMNYHYAVSKKDTVTSAINELKNNYLASIGKCKKLILGG